MLVRLRAAAAGGLAVLAIFPGPMQAAPTPSPRPTASAARIVAGTPPRDPETLYAARTRRLLRTLLLLRLLELREAGLDRARAVVEGRLRVDDLLGPADRPPR